MNQNALIKKTVAAHTAAFGKEPESAAWAPGRIEVLGNHTDYNEGTVLSAAIDLGICFCISHSTENGIHALAVDVDQETRFDTTDRRNVPDAAWADYIKGTFYYIQEELKQQITGLNCTFSGSIPPGAGLSSSAAIEVAAATALLKLLNKSIAPKKTAILCRKAEHIFAGTNCGLLDQFSSLFGQEHSLIHSDFRTLDVTPVSIPNDIEFLIINPHAQHSLSESPYNERRERCEQAAAELNVSSLREISPDQFKSLKNRIDPAAAKRAAHVVGEIDRVETGVDLLNRNQINSFGQLLFESHESSIRNFENSCPEINVVVNAAREAGALGARISGGGFGGSAIAMIHSREAEKTAEIITAYCKQKNIHPDIIEAVPSAGAQSIENVI